MVATAMVSMGTLHGINRVYTVSTSKSPFTFVGERSAVRASSAYTETRLRQDNGGCQPSGGGGGCVNARPATAAAARFLASATLSASADSATSRVLGTPALSMARTCALQTAAARGHEYACCAL